MVTLWFACAPSAPPPPEPVVTGPATVRAVVGSTAVELRSATRTLTGPRPVRLVGAVHVGDPAYYAAVSQLLSGCGAVLYEGLEADPAAPAPSDDDVASLLAAVGLTFQSDALAADERFVRVDRSAAEVRAKLLGAPDGAAKADEWLVDRDRDALRTALASVNADPTSDRLKAVVRLSILRGLSRPGERDPAYWDVVVGERDQHVVDTVVAWPRDEELCVLYGADHLPDLEARLRRRGWAPAGSTELVVVAVPFADAGLGPVQVRQWLTAP